jgi:hypothetical protein
VGKGIYAEVSRTVLEELERNRYSLDIRMPLLPEARDSLEEKDALIVLGVHPHETLHEVLLHQLGPLSQDRLHRSDSFTLHALFSAS